VGKKTDAERGRKMVLAAMHQTCSTCVVKNLGKCRAELRCFNKFLLNLSDIQERATP